MVQTALITLPSQFLGTLLIVLKWREIKLGKNGTNRSNFHLASFLRLLFGAKKQQIKKINVIFFCSFKQKCLWTK
jgi:hypothetical protein